MTITVQTVEIESVYGNYTMEIECVEGCERCPDPYVPHFNCLYGGNACGHSKAHCTANGCY
jgi:hypothetical protein